MASRPFLAVMHCSPLQPKKLIALLNKVIAKLTANAVTYPSPNPTVVVLQAEATPFANLIAAAKAGGSEATAARNKEALKVHGLLKTELTYVNGIAKNDKDLILLSGFDASNEPTPAAIPDVPVIKSIEDGETNGSAKILLAKTSSPLLSTPTKRTFIVEMTTDATDDTTYAIVLLTGSSKNLVIPNLIRGVEVFIRIAAMNAKGQSKYSSVVSFIPRSGASPATGAKASPAKT